MERRAEAESNRGPTAYQLTPYRVAEPAHFEAKSVADNMYTALSDYRSFLVLL